MPRAPPGYTGRVTVPVLFDKQSGRIVSNESADIVRMLNGAFGDGGRPRPETITPNRSEREIDALNERIYTTLNNGVYRAGFATTQAAYEEAVDEVFATLDELDARLAHDVSSAARRRPKPTGDCSRHCARFDVAYHYAFKCNLRRLVDYPHLWPYTRDLYQTGNIRDTVRLDLYKQGYFSISELRNPLGIVPKGPIVDFEAPHGRARLAA